MGFSPLFVTRGTFWKGETRLSEEVGMEHCLMWLKALGAWVGWCLGPLGTGTLRLNLAYFIILSQGRLE